MIHLVRGVPSADESHITGFDSPRIDQAPFVGLDVFLVLPDPQTGRIIVVVVKNCLYSGNKVWIFRNLNDHIPVDTGLAVVVERQFLYPK